MGMSQDFEAALAEGANMVRIGTAIGKTGPCRAHSHSKRRQPESAHESGRPPMKLAFIGGGNMARAIIGGLVAKGARAADIVVVELDAVARLKLVSESSASRRLSEKPGAQTRRDGRGRLRREAVMRPRRKRSRRISSIPSSSPSRRASASRACRAGWAGSSASCARCPTPPRSCMCGDDGGPRTVGRAATTATRPRRSCPRSAWPCGSRTSRTSTP